MPLLIERNNIAKVHADVLVNAANERLAAGGGVCGAIFAGAGHEDMRAACAELAPCPTGSAVVTPAFGLDARWVVHAVGPVWRGGGRGERELLASAYAAVFARARELGAASVALPLISAGIYGYPAAESLELATAAARAFLAEQPDATVTLVVFDRGSFAAGLERYGEVASYVDDAFVDDALARRRPSEAEFADEGTWPLETDKPLVDALEPAASGPAPAASSASRYRSLRDRLFPHKPEGSEAPGAQPDALEPALSAPEPAACAKAPAPSAPIDRSDIASLLATMDASFSQTVLALIDERGLTDAEVYKRANLSRQLFSKIRSHADYRPTKPTAVALAMALGLSLDETQELLARAGLALGRSSKFDVIVMCFIERGCYDVFELNQMLFAFDQPLIGSM